MVIASKRAAYATTMNLVSLLAVPFTLITESEVPLFIPNKALEKELKSFRRMASGFCRVSLGCKDANLKHVQSETDNVSVADSVSQNVDLYSLEEINAFFG